MLNKYKKIIDALLSNACPSNKYRVKKEILQESMDTPELRNLQEQILVDDDAIQFLNNTKPDGCFGKDFHGDNSIESAVRWLCEKGVINQNRVIKDVYIALERYPDRLSLSIGKVGRSKGRLQSDSFVRNHY